MDVSAIRIDALMADALLDLAELAHQARRGTGKALPAPPRQEPVGHQQHGHAPAQHPKGVR